MYELEPEDGPHAGVRQLKETKPGFFESWWAIVLFSFAAGTLVPLAVGSYLTANFPEFPRMLATLPICGAFGFTFGYFWSKNRIAKRKQREAARLELEEDR